jgi:RHS repeat-associated protein
MDDPSTAAVTEGFGLMFYNARWYDPALGRFTQADTIVPAGVQGAQAWDRYAFVNNNPVRYTDPSGHKACDETDANGNCYTEDDITKGKKEAASKQGCSNPTYCENGKPKSPSSNLGDIVQEEYNPIEAYCGDASTLGCLSMLAQDVATLIDLIGVGLIEAPLTIAGCLEGPLGCALGEFEAWQVWNTTLNGPETFFSFTSFVFTLADDLINNDGWGENSSTSLTTLLAGQLPLTPLLGSCC